MRYQPSYLSQSACFRKSNGALTCLTCHDTHSPLTKAATHYDGKCVECHQAVKHTGMASTGRTCVGCHMPQVMISAQLTFTNHWVGIYAKGGSNLVPARTATKSVPPPWPGASPKAAPADAASLIPLFEQELKDREKRAGPDDPKVARSASDLGLFLVGMHNPEAAEPPLRKALAIDLKHIEEGHAAPEVAADREQLGELLAETGPYPEAIELFRDAAAGPDAKAASRSLASLALLDPSHAEEHYRAALTAERRAADRPAEERDWRREAILLNNLAATLQERKSYSSALGLFREALLIQQKTSGSDSPAGASTMSNLGSLLETMGNRVEAEQTERKAIGIFERKFGPWSAELATSCSNLADILWTKGDRAECGQSISARDFDR